MKTNDSAKTWLTRAITFGLLTLRPDLTAAARPFGAPAPGPRLQPLPHFASDLMDYVPCLHNQGVCAIQGNDLPLASVARLKAPKLTRAKKVRGTIPMGGCNYLGPTVNVTAGANVDKNSPLYEVQFDTGSSSPALFGPDTIEISHSNATSVSVSLATTAEFSGTSTTQSNGLAYTEPYAKSTLYGLGQEDVAGIVGAPRAPLNFITIDEVDDMLITDHCVPDKPKDATLSGIWGMGMGGPEALEGVDAYFLTIAPQLPDPSFAVALCGTGGSLKMGTPDAEFLASPFMYGINQPTFYSHSIAVSGLEVSGMRLPYDETDIGPMLFDTGSTGISFPSEIADAITIAMGELPNDLDVELGLLETNCFTLPRNMTLEALDQSWPTLTYHVPSATDPGKAHKWTFSASNSYAIPAKNSDGSTEICLLIGGTNSEKNGTNYSILGNNAMRGLWTHFDPFRNRTGLALAQGTCE